MGMFSKLVIASFISLAGLSAHADTQITCANKTNTIKLQYIVKSTASKRLASDLLFTKPSGIQLISTSQVAQYATTNILLYILADNSAEAVTLRFTAVPTSKTTWVGAIEEVGASTVTTAVKCTSVAI